MGLVANLAATLLCVVTGLIGGRARTVGAVAVLLTVAGLAFSHTCFHRLKPARLNIPPAHSGARRRVSFRVSSRKKPVPERTKTIARASLPVRSGASVPAR